MNVVAISGASKAGGVTLGRMLGELPGVFQGGELRHMWGRSLRDNKVCGCGHAFRDCPFWREVGDRAFGGWDRLDAARMVELDEQLHGPGAAAGLLGSPRIRAMADEYGYATGRVMAALGEVTGASVIIDLTKPPTRGLVLRHVPGVGVRWVHIVRDPRDVAWLWMTRERLGRPADGSFRNPGDIRPVPAPYRSVPWTVTNWLTYNPAPPTLARLGKVPYLRVRYEDMTARPQETVLRVSSFIGAPAAAEALPFMADHTIDLSADHIIPCVFMAAGTRPLLEAGPRTLRVRGEWRERMPATVKAGVTAATAPMLAGFGYVGRRN